MSSATNSVHFERVKALCGNRGLVLRPCGRGWRIVGPRVDVLYAYLNDVSERDLLPVKANTMAARG